MNSWDYYIVTPVVLAGGLLVAFLIVSVIVSTLFGRKRN